MTPDAALELAREWAERGVPAFPIAISWDQTKYAGAGGTNKRPLTDRGHNSASTSEATLVRLFSAAAGRLKAGEELAVGLHPGPAGRVVLDVDDKGGKRGSDELAALQAAHAPLPDHPVVLTPSGGTHRWFRKPDDVHVGNTDLADGVEIRSDDGWVVAPGVVTPWGSWEPEEITLVPAPLWPDWIAERLTRRKGTPNGTGDTRPSRWAQIDPATLHPADRAALEALKRLGGHAEHVGGDGSLRVTRPGKQSGVSATIGYTAPGVVNVWTDNWPHLGKGWHSLDGDGRLIPDGTHSSTPNASTLSAPSVATTTDEQSTGAALEFTSFAELAAEVDAMGPRQWLIEGLWPAGDYGVHAAEAKAQKTWNSVDLAVSVATDTPWLGAYPIGTPGPVLIFHGEGGKQSIVRRIRAVLRARDIDHDDVPIAVCVRAPHLSDGQHMAELEQRIADTKPALVILDPLYLAARGGDKGDLYSMGGMLETPQRICQKHGASFFVVHHFNRQHGTGAGRISGAGPSEWARVLLTATVKSRHTDPTTRATDVITELEVVGGEIPDRTIRVRRHVEAVDPDDLDSVLHVTVTATDKDDTGAGDTETDADLPPAARKLLQALEAADGEPRTGSALVDWIAENHGHGLTRETVSRTLNDLEGRGLVDSVDQGQFKAKLWMLRPPEPSCDSCDVTRDGHTDDCRVTRVTTPIGGHTSHVTPSHHTDEPNSHHAEICRICGTPDGLVRVGGTDDWTCDPCWPGAEVSA